ncbi:hypothetical protein BHM03_00047942 [Ensete ventricosum]|nr:hypothetical protein BHM03_00047942 [Ensete ventricosum]
MKSCAVEVEFRSVFRAPSRKFKILAIIDVLVHATLRVEFRSVFHAPSRKFKILAIPDVLAHGKSYEQGSLACVRECSGLLGLALALTIAAAEGDYSLGRFLLYDRSAANSSVEGWRSLLRSAIPSGESVISGVEGQRLFSPRRGTDSRARNGGGCAAIGAGFTAALVWEGWWLPLPLATGGL